MPTIKEIAEMAGVHRSTVDKVLHHREGVSDAVRARVQKILDEVHYEVNPIGKALKHQQEKIRIAAVLLQVDALPEWRVGIDRAARELGRFNIAVEYFFLPFPDAEKQAAVLQGLVAQDFSGVLVSPLHAPEVETALDALARAKIPVITLNTDCANPKHRLCFVGQDMEKAGRTAARMAALFLQERGTIAVLGSNRYLAATKGRDTGFRTYFAEQPGIHVLPFVETLEDPRRTFEATRTLLAQAPDLIYATSGCVHEICHVLRGLPPASRPHLICFEKYPAIEQYLREGVIDCSICGDLVSQGYTGMNQLFRYLMMQDCPQEDTLFLPISIQLKENL